MKLFSQTFILRRRRGRQSMVFSLKVKFKEDSDYPGRLKQRMQRVGHKL
jgi:hypothetical protein